MTPSVRLLGSVRVRVGDDVWEPPSHLTTALLAYLAQQGDWVDRSALAAMFWPESDQASALRNLRSLLARCKREPFAVGLEIEASRVRWHVACDAGRFQRAVASEAWADAVALYDGVFLAGMAFDASPVYEAWLEWTREHLKDGYQTAALRLADERWAAGDLTGALDVARALVRHDPIDEAATQLLMRLYACEGRRDTAQRAYRTFAQRLEAELDLEPSSATTELLDRIDRGDRLAAGRDGHAYASKDLGTPTAAAEHPDRAPSSTAVGVGRPETATDAGLHGAIPAALTSFFGREEEVDTIGEHFTRPDGRLVTITGAGGVGKTRLAAVAAERLQSSYSHGVGFAPLESVTSPADVPGAIAQALGLDLRTREPPGAQLVRAIGQRNVLLVLDNFEHLLPATSVIPTLLNGCPGLDVLVTSRERLGLPFERLVDLRGLPYPTDTPAAGDAERFDALVCLFARMRQVRPDVSADPDTLAPAAEICRLVQGLPLALELAAVWVRSMPLDRIAGEIRRNLDFLSFGPAAASSRHRSVRAAFEHSWKLLTPAERDAMRKLSVFRGGFRRSAAAFVADASIAVLAALVDKSLLRVALDGRYDCHPLIAAFAFEKLQGDPDEEHVARRRHAEYLLWLLEQAQPTFETPHRVSWQQRLESERENVSAALEFARGERDAALGTQLVLLLRWLYWPWSFITARRELVEDLVSIPGEVRPEVRAAAYHVAGVIAHSEGDIPKAVDMYRMAIELADPRLQANILVRLHSNLGTIERDLGNTEAARDLLARGLELRDHLGDTPSTANLLNNIGTQERLDGNMPAAQRAHEQALEIGRRLQNPLTICQSLNGLAYVERDLERDDAAAAMFQETLELALRHEIDSAIIASLHALGRAARRHGDLATAAERHARALDIVGATRTFRLLDRTLDGAADLLAATARHRDAARVWGAAESVRRERGAVQSQDPPPDRADLQRSTRKALGDEAFETAFSSGASLEHDAAIAVALSALEPARVRTTPS